MGCKELSIINPNKTEKKKTIGNTNLFSTVNLNVNGINSSMKWCRLIDWIKKWDSTIYCLQQTHNYQVHTEAGSQMMKSSQLTKRFLNFLLNLLSNAFINDTKIPIGNPDFPHYPQRCDTQGLSNWNRHLKYFSKSTHFLLVLLR